MRRPNKKIRVQRDGYCVDPYTRSDGTRVSGYCTDPTTFEIDDPGRSGRGARGAKAGPHKDKSAWIQREGKLGGAGYTRKSTRTRHRLLERCVEAYGYRSCLGSLLVIPRNTSIKPETRAIVEADVAWLKARYGSPSRAANPAKQFYEVYSLEELLAMPTRDETEAHALKVDRGDVRWWVAKLTPAEGEDYQVYVEELLETPAGPRWIHAHVYAAYGPAFDPSAAADGYQDEYATYYADKDGGTRAVVHRTGNPWEHVGGGCLIDPTDPYPCDEEFEHAETGEYRTISNRSRDEHFATPTYGKVFTDDELAMMQEHVESRRRANSAARTLTTDELEFLAELRSMDCEAEKSGRYYDAYHFVGKNDPLYMEVVGPLLRDRLVKLVEDGPDHVAVAYDYVAAEGLFLDAQRRTSKKGRRADLRSLNGRARNARARREAIQTKHRLTRM